MLLILLTIPLISQSNEVGTVKVCTDDDNWFPYVYLKNGNSNEVEGIVISLTKRVLSDIGFDWSYHALPWVRCLEKLKAGEVDVLIAGTYTPERATYAFFPEDADKMVDSRFVIARDPFVIVTHKSNTFIYDGNDSLIPSPIRAQHGYNVTQELINKGLNVKSVYENKKALEELIQSKKGSVLINRMSADRLLSEPKFGKHLHYNSTPIRVLPYFIMFSKKSPKLDSKQRMAFYEQIKDWRERIGASYTY